jgi:tRNA threonylcarbamoyladenosine biosynthesis protein TsaB
MVKVLAIDTSTGACSAAVTSGGTAVAVRSRPMRQGHAEALLPMVLEVLDEAAIGFARLDLLAVTVGPGSFTGLRVGIAGVRGMMLAAGLPCIGVTTFDALAASCAEAADERLLIAIDSRRGALFVQSFASDGQATTAPDQLAPSDLAQTLEPGRIAVAGDGAAAVVAALTAAGFEARAFDVAWPSPVAVAVRATERWRAGCRCAAMPTPLYLRAADTGPTGGGPL